MLPDVRLVFLALRRIFAGSPLVKNKNTCTALRTVYLPLSLHTVYENAFYGCAGVASVPYEGNVTQFSYITFFPGNGVIVYAYTQKK